MTRPIFIIAFCNILFLTLLVSCKESPDCQRDPGFPISGFNPACLGGSLELSLSTVTKPDARRFSLTDNHAIWWDAAPSLSSKNSLYFVYYGGDCNNPPNDAALIKNANASETQDAVTNWQNTSESYVYFDGPELELKSVRLSGNVIDTPLLFKPLHDQLTPAAYGSKLPSGKPINTFAWVENNDVWMCPKIECKQADIIRVTNSSDRDHNPRIYGKTIVWENQTTRKVMILEAGAGATARIVDDGAQPDVHGDWVVYAKLEPSPTTTNPFDRNNPVHCDTWEEHWQLWVYGPLSKNPTSFRMSGVKYWGAGQYTHPRLTDDYVVCKVNYINNNSKTVIGLYPIKAFGKSNVAMKEIDDKGHAEGNVDAWQGKDSKLYVLYRDGATNSARLKCCNPAF